MLKKTRRTLLGALLWSLGIDGHADAPEARTQPYRPRGDKAWATVLVAGPLTSFGTDGRQHTCAPACEPSSNFYRPCFTQQPYEPQMGRETSC